MQPTQTPKRTSLLLISLCVAGVLRHGDGDTRPRLRVRAREVVPRSTVGAQSAYQSQIARSVHRPHRHNAASTLETPFCGPINTSIRPAAPAWPRTVQTVQLVAALELEWSHALVARYYHARVHEIGLSLGGGAVINFQHSRAMAQSSCARMTRIRTGESAVAISASSRGFWLAASSRFSPRNFRGPQVAERTSGEFSPTPAVNTSASMPPSTAVIAPIPALQAMHVHIERQLGAPVFLPDRGQNFTHVAGNPRDSQQSRLLVQNIINLLGHPVGLGASSRSEFQGRSNQSACPSSAPPGE